MSFILESIKQAERERKLGQEAPSISIEYTGEHFDDIDDNKNKWMIFSIALFITALLVWGATYYFANKDRQFVDKYVEELALSDAGSPVQAINQANSNLLGTKNEKAVTVTRDIEMVPVKSEHKSKLKSVKLISADEQAPKTKVAEVAEVVKVNKPAASKQISRDAKPIVAKAQPKLVKELPTLVSSKQELATIYSDLAALSKQEPIVSEPNRHKEDNSQIQFVEEAVQIEEANYVVPQVRPEVKPEIKPEIKQELIRNPETKPAVPEHAVSTGVPSFGELPHDVQANIPDFNVSVHMFHADPMQRRIRINGQMYTEGKSLQQDLALLEITRYGAVFDYQGHKFRLNVR